MKHLNIFGIITMLLIFAFVGCGGSSGPEDIVKDFFKSIEAGNVDAASDMMSTQIVSMLGKEKLAQAIEEQSKEIKGKGGISSIDIKDKEETKDAITMNVTITYGDGSTKTEKTKLVLEDGKWKIGIAK